MLSVPIPASTDLSFFSSSRGSTQHASTSSTVVVKTRLTRRPAPKQGTSSSPARSAHSSSSSPLSSPLSSPSSSPRRKRKSPSASVSEPSSALPREVKRLRVDKPRKRASSASKTSSRASSYQSLLPPSPEPIYRSSRSRSASHFHSAEADTPVTRRRWATSENGLPGSSHLSSEGVVKRLMKSYKGCEWHTRFSKF